MKTVFGPYDSEQAFLFHEMIKEVGLGSEGGRKTYAKGTFIFREGMYPVGLFCLIDGKVKISRLNEDGREQIVRLYGPNDVVGYKSLVMESPYHASAIALEDTELGFVSKDDFDDIIEKNPKVARLFMKILCKNLDQSEDLMESLASKNIREKVAGILVLLSEKYGLDNQDVLRVQLSREEIAGMIGIATENLSRALTQFREEQLIESIGRKIAIKNKEGLIKVRGEI